MVVEAISTLTAVLLLEFFARMRYQDVMLPSDESSLRFELATLGAILPLRHAILRPDLPGDTARFDGDDLETTRHFAACLRGRVVCCLSLYASQWRGTQAVQLRGMATTREWQRQGIGRRLLDFALDPTDLHWCNARVEAIGFYAKAGWTVESEPFEIPTVGPHVKMLRLPQP